MSLGGEEEGGRILEVLLYGRTSQIPARPPGPQCIPYAVLLEALALRNVRQLEDLVIEAVYADVLRGSLDQRNQRLEVDYSIGRDIQRQDLSAIARTLQEW